MKGLITPNLSKKEMVGSVQMNGFFNTSIKETQQRKHARKFLGVTLVEILIAITLFGVIAAFGISKVIGMNPNDDDQLGRKAHDFFKHLSAACNITRSKYGSGPFNAKYYDTTDSRYEYVYTDDQSELPSDNTDCGSNCHVTLPETNTTKNAYRGWKLFLPNWESAASYNDTVAGQERMVYPDNTLLYFYGDRAVDPEGEITDHVTSGFQHDDIMTNGTTGQAYIDDRLWMKLIFYDIKTAPNADSIAVNGDSVLFMVEDDTCIVKTAKQKCDELSCDEAFGQSFYDKWVADHK